MPENHRPDEVWGLDTPWISLSTTVLTVQNLQKSVLCYGVVWPTWHAEEELAKGSVWPLFFRSSTHVTLGGRFRLVRQCSDRSPSSSADTAKYKL